MQFSITLKWIENRATYQNLKEDRSLNALTQEDIQLLWLPEVIYENTDQTRQSKHCGFSIYIFDNSKSKSMVRLVRAENMVLSGLVFARKIARMILIQNI